MRIILHGIVDSAQLNGERYILQHEEHFADNTTTLGQRRFVWRNTDGVGRFSNDSMGAALETMQRAQANQPPAAPRHYQPTTFATAESNGQWYRLMNVGDSYVWYSLRTGDHHPVLETASRHTFLGNAITEMRRVQEDERAAAAALERFFGVGTPTPPFEGTPTPPFEGTPTDVEAPPVPDETAWGDWPTPEGVLYNESLLRRADNRATRLSEMCDRLRGFGHPIIDPGHGGPIPAPTRPINLDDVFDTMRGEPGGAGTAILHRPANRPPVYPPSAPMHTKNVNKP